MDCYALARSQTQHFNLLEEYQLPILVAEVYQLKVMALPVVLALYRGGSHGDLSSHVIYFSWNDVH